MKVSLTEKSSIDEIRARFDADVERFSNLETGQSATIDAQLVLDLVARSTTLHLQPGGRILDLGCGAGNFTLRVLQEVSPLDCDLVDLSTPMLERAYARVSDSGRAGEVATHASDLRALDFPDQSFDAILAAAVLHHLRDDADWEDVFTKLHRWLKPGVRLYVSDLLLFEDAHIQELMWARYGDYLVSLGGADYRDKVFAYIEKEDSPRSLPYQLRLLDRSGFSGWEVLHRNSVFGCYVGLK